MMEDILDKAKELLSDKLDLPRDIMLDVPKITILGDREINIENHKGIVAFDDSLIKVNSKAGIICIQGTSFEIVFIGGNTLVLNGKFSNIYYEGK